MLVCTPGSLTGLSFDTGVELDFSRLKYLVIDEADQMEGEWLKTLESKIPRQCQKLLFSATLASDPQFLAALKVQNINSNDYVFRVLVETSNALFNWRSIGNTKRPSRRKNRD